MNPVVLYCFPYAGGNAWSYRPLTACCPPDLAVTGIELPGHGRRSGEAPCRDLETLADDGFAQLRPAIARGPYALFGHSMGALLAYLCALRIHQAALPLPQALFLSGQAAPGLAGETRRHRLPRDEFLRMLETLGGCPPELLQEKELIDYFEPILRADFEAVETWRPRQQESALPIPIILFRGSGEDLAPEATLAWSRHTTAGFELHRLEGGHFFIQNQWHAIASIITSTLNTRTAEQ